MDTSKLKDYPNPRDGANPLSIIFFTYTFSMFKKGYKKILGVEDIYNPLKSDKSEVLANRLEKNWKKHYDSVRKRNKNPSFFRVLVKTFWPEYFYLGFLEVMIDIVIRISQPLLLGYLLDFFKPNSTTTREEAFYYAGGVVALNATAAVFLNQYMVNGFHYGMKMRAACCAIIYRKALKLSRTALGGTASGKVVNLLSNDVSRFDLVSLCIHPLWVAPLSTLIIAYFLWAEAGYAGLIGIVPVFLIVPLQSWTGKMSSKFRKQTALKTDERVRLMDEIIGGIQVIKMYAWEKPFSKLIQMARRKELKIVTKLSYVRGLFMTFNLFTTRVALFCSLLTMALSGQEISAAKVFVFMSYYNIISQTMSTMFVRGFAEVAEVLVSIKRIQEFLMNDEYSSTSINYNNAELKFDSYALNLKNVTAKWNPENSDSALKEITLDLKKGQLLGVIGPVGSGKSSLLLTLLGELSIAEGNIEVNGSVSYASQEPWVFAASVRQNILFGEKYDKTRYNDVVRVCALDKDFEQFTNGDMTIVGDRGASLSGGQKARINLARAVYRKSDIYLLDDPLSAVDIHVAKHLYKHCINGFLKHKTRILVTHQVYTLKDAGNIAIFKNGTLEAMGSSHVLSQTGIEYAKLLVKEPELKSENPDEIDREKLIERVKLARQLSNMSRHSRQSSLTLSETSIIESLYAEESNADEVEEVKAVQEDSSKGKVKGSLSINYLRAGGNIIFVICVLFLFLLAQLFASGTDYFVSMWTNIEEERKSTPQSLSMNECLYIYGSVIAGLFIVAFTRSMLFYKLAMLASQKLHDILFNNVIFTTMGFFNTNPSGRILNRFAKDMGSIDEQLPKAFLDAGQINLLMVGSIVLVALVNPYFLIPAAVIGCIFWFMRSVFLKSSKNIRRVEGILRSPAFTHLNASIQGLTTIRAFGAQQILTDEFDKHQDYHSGSWFMYITAASAFGFYLDVLCFVFTGLVTFSFLIINDESAAGGDVGLAITQAAALTGMVQWGLRQSAEAANQLMSVERVMEYNTLPKEIQPDIPKNPPKEWPQHGKLTFDHMSMRYEEAGARALNDLNIVIQPREKVGVVGRTGAGKSSLISALFRLAFVEGKIDIDGVDTKDLNLQYLRSKISIIPQDPVLFSGTLRYNLDPFQEYPDEVLWKALEEVELKDPSNTINRLESIVMDRGSNYSVGQRQLICLARALVRNNKILMLDEATANVDPQTDELIQRTIRVKFSDCTVMTVAHRLNTIMDSDKVIVMETGTIVEANHPHLLLEDANSKFYNMVSKTDKSTFEQLKTIAKKAFEQQK